MSPKTTRAMISSFLIVAGCIALLSLEKKGAERATEAPKMRYEAHAEIKKPTSRTSPSSPSVEVRLPLSAQFENWRDAPVGDGEDTLDSYHSYDHRPPGMDPRDELLKQYTIHKCPNNGNGTMVSGQDPRYYEIDPPDNKDYKERNPKFLCDVFKLPQSSHSPCVVYSFGSWDEISFEIGMNEATNHLCHVHTFDPAKPPSAETANQNNFVAHKLGIGNADTEDGTIKKLSTIMQQLGHSHIHVLKIDVEGHERESLPNIVEEGILENVEQLSIEFHSNDLMKQGLDLLVGAGFGIVYARREDRCGWCTEVTMVKL